MDETKTIPRVEMPVSVNFPVPKKADLLDAIANEMGSLNGHFEAATALIRDLESIISGEEDERDSDS